MYPKRPSPSTEKEVFPAFPRISPNCPSSADLSGKKRLFSLQTQKCRRGFLKFLPPADLPPPFSCKFLLSLLLQVFLSRPADGGAGKKYDAAPEPPFPAVGGEGRAKKRENTESGSETKWEGRGQKSAARAVRRKAMRVGKRKKRRETAEAPPKVLGAPLPKKARCRRRKTDRKKRHKRQVLQKPLRQTKLFVSRTLRQARFCSGKSEKRAEKAFASRKMPVAADRRPTERNAIKDRFYKNPCGKPSFLQAEPYGRQGFVRGIERARAEKAFATGQSLRTQQKKPETTFRTFFSRADGCRPLQTPPFKRIAPRQRISLPRP